MEFFEVFFDLNIIVFLGNEGYILLVFFKIKELIGIFKMNGTVRLLVFIFDG